MKYYQRPEGSVCMSFIGGEEAACPVTQSTCLLNALGLSILVTLLMRQSTYPHNIQTLGED